MLEFSSIKYPKARKEHKCELCNKTINVKEVYFHRVGKCDGDMFSETLCLSCGKILQEYWDYLQDIGEEEYDFDGIRQWLSDVNCYECKNREDCEYGYANVAQCPLIIDKYAD